MPLGQGEWYDLLDSGLNSPEVSRQSWRIWLFGGVIEYVDRDRLGFSASEFQKQSEESAVKLSQREDLPQINCVSAKVYASSILSLVEIFPARRYPCRVVLGVGSETIRSN